MQGNRSYPGRPLAGVRRKGSVVRRTQEAPVDGNDFLCHYGIAGQKWGVRRFQNEDRTLTEEGKRRYAKEPESKRWKKEDVSDLSDEELNRRNSRLQREQTYKQLTTTKKEREQAARKEWLKNQKLDILKKVFIAGATVMAAAAIKKNYQKAASFIGRLIKRKIAPYKAAGIMKNVLKNQNIPDKMAPVKEIVGKHVFHV